MKVLGIIGGSGLYRFAEQGDSQQIETPYGVVPVSKFDYAGKKIIFLPRHGEKHHLPPHKINYRANIYAMKHSQVEGILSTSAVGSMLDEFCPGMFAPIGQFIDCTKNRIDTYYDSFEKGIHHSDMSQAYDEHQNQLIMEACKQNSIPFMQPLTLVVTEGPRFESSAEINAFKCWGGEIVGMTGYPEVALARELKIPFSSIAISTNYAAGISPSPLSHDEVVAQMKLSSKNLIQVIRSFINLF